MPVAPAPARLHRACAVLVALLLFPVAHAQPDRCTALTASSDGVPATYYRAACRAQAALMAGDAVAAEGHIRQALALPLPDAANYLLKPDLAEALCRQGRMADAQAELRDFQCMAGVELGQRSCSERGRLPGGCAQLCATVRPQACQAHLAVLPALQQHAAELLRDCAQAGQPAPASAPPVPGARAPGQDDASMAASPSADPGAAP